MNPEMKFGMFLPSMPLFSLPMILHHSKAYSLGFNGNNVFLFLRGQGKILGYSYLFG